MIHFDKRSWRLRLLPSHKTRQSLILSFILFPLLSFAQTPLLDQMTLEEKVGQILMVHFHGEVVNEDALCLIENAHVGGFIFFNWSNGLSSPEQVQQLTLELQAQAQQTPIGIPLFLAVDHEGSIVTRLKHGFTVYPGNGAIAKTGSPHYALRCAKAMGEELKAVGINMTLGPVVDVNSNLLNPIIGVRSFSVIPEVVTTFGRAALEGYRNSDTIAVLKHFPGHGDVTQDSHYDLPVVNKSIHQLTSTELYPFMNLAPHADMIMTSHLLVPALDPFTCATLSKTIITDLLRNKIGFQGVIISDSLVMQGLLKGCPCIEEAAIRAFEAGNDILILGGLQLLSEKKGLELTVNQILKVYHSLLEAVKTGRISNARLNASVARILHLKEKYHLFDYQFPDVLEIKQKVNNAEHKKLAQEIAYHALHADGTDQLAPISYSKQKVVVLAPQATQYDINLTSLTTIGKETQVMFFRHLNPTPEEMIQAEKLIEWADAIIVCTYNAWKNTNQAAFIHNLAQKNKPVTIIALRDPQDHALFKEEVDVCVTTSSPDAYSIQCAIDLITGANNAK